MRALAALLRCTEQVGAIDVGLELTRIEQEAPKTSFKVCNGGGRSDGVWQRVPDRAQLILGGQPGPGSSESRNCEIEGVVPTSRGYETPSACNRGW